MSLYRKINPNLSRKAKQNEIADSSSNETLPWSPWSTEASIERLGFLYDAPLCWINHPSTEPLGKSPQSNGCQPTIDRDSLEVISNLIQRAWALLRTRMSSLIFFPSWIQMRFDLHQTFSSKIRDGTRTGLIVYGLTL